MLARLQPLYPLFCFWISVVFHLIHSNPGLSQVHSTTKTVPTISKSSHRGPLITPPRSAYCLLFFSPYFIYSLVFYSSESFKLTTESRDDIPGLHPCLLWNYSHLCTQTGSKAQRRRKRKVWREHASGGHSVGEHEVRVVTQVCFQGMAQEETLRTATNQGHHRKWATNN